MQFHLNGYNPGDPRFADPQDAVVPPPIKRPLPEYVDVMIVGCGPAGLNLAAQLDGGTPGKMESDYSHKRSSDGSGHTGFSRTYMAYEIV